MKTTIFAMTALMLSLAACSEKGPAEQAGEEVDEAVDTLQRKAESAGEKIDDAADDVRDDLQQQ